MSSPKLHRFVRHALTVATGVARPDVKQLAAAFDLLCDRLRSRLQPMFGTAAISALFARGRRVATSEFPWLGRVLPKDGKPCSAEGLETILGHIDADAIADGLATVLAQDIGLLSAFIGEDLVMPFVQEAWGAASAARPASEDRGNP